MECNNRKHIGVPVDNLERALNCDKSVFIQACAGAGKTFALTKRYAAILDSFAKKIEQGADPEKFDQKRILVITFTKKATGEMNRRIYEDVNILLNGNKPKGMEDRNFCPTLRNSRHENVCKFTQNLKDTFSRNSISTIDSFCANILREFAYKLNLDPQFLSQDEHDTKKLLNETLDAWISDMLKDDPGYFNSLLDELSFYQIKEILKSMYGSREVLDEYINDFEIKPHDEIWREWLINYLADADVEMLSLRFDALWTYAQESCKVKSDGLFILLKYLNEQLCELGRNVDPLEYRAAFYSAIRSSKLFTSKKEYRASLPGNKGNWKEGKSLAEDWFDLLKKTEAKEIQMSPGPQDKKIIPLLKSLIKSYRDFDKYFFNIRMERDLLDFSDVIILTHKLIKENEDVRNILGKRYRHIMLDEFQDTNPLRWQIIEMILNAGEDIKLFIVGDRKQSIYRFNNADVTVMDVAQRYIGEEAVEFDDNYRSSEKFIKEAINDVMPNILKVPGESREKYEAVFEETHFSSKKENKPDIDEAAIERIWCEHSNEDEEYIPAYHTAYQVQHLLEKYENSKIDVKQDEPLIGVLLRRGTKLGEYLQAFHKFDVPVSIVGGKDFYDSPALRDIFHLISVLDNPLDDHALIGLLRSPFFALADPVIHQLADRAKKTVFEAMSSIPKLQQAYHDLLILKERSKTVPLDELISDIIDKDDRELAYVSELMPEQQLANLDKAVNIIRGLVRSGSSLREIREYFYYQIKTKADDSQADYPAKARVQILTVHKAKGLEFPIIVIPEMNSKGNSTKDKFRFGKHDDRPEITLSLGDEEKPGLLMRLKEITKNEEEAEDKRVFYVAVTRAIHKVVLLGEGKEKSSANSWWTKYVLQFTDPEKEDLLSENWSEKIEMITAEEIMPSQSGKVIDTLPWKERVGFEAPGKYLYRSPHDLMGMDEEKDFEFAKTGLGTAPGNIFHYCMEKGWLDLETHKKEIKIHIRENYADLPENELMNKLKPWLDNIISHEMGRIILDPGIEKYAEHQVKGWLGNGKDIVQVNGNIDLLYRQNGQWVILDYKTDTSKRLLSYYTLQLQSYQWILKQVYGIDALAKIYFVSLNELEEIAWDENYFNEIKLEPDVRAELPPVSVDISKLILEIKADKHLILCASAQHEEQLYLALAREGMLRPDIKISTLNKFVQEGREELISQDKLRLMIRHKNPDMKNGTADLLAKALRDEELQKGKIKNDFRNSYANIKSMSSYHSAAEPYLKATAGGSRVILLDVYVDTELEKALIERLSVETDVIHLSLNPDNSSDRYSLISAFSPREEVLACAKHIKENCAENEQILIAVASMEKYAPHLQRQFSPLGLRARFIGPRSLYEFPCTTLLMNYLKLCSKGKHEWSELAVVNLHALMRPGDHLLAHDKGLRQEPMKELPLPQTDIRFCEKSSELLEFITKFAEDLKKDKDSDTDKTCDKFLEILERVIKDLTNLDAKADIKTIYREMSERIKKESIPRRDQWNGIPVVGLLDSLGVQSDKLYILGMVEGDIPRQEGDNPFFSRNGDHTLELNRYFMSEWKKRGDKVIFCTSTHAEDGSEQNRSSFLEDMKLNVINDVAVSRREELLKYAGRRISGNNSVLVDRHHEFLAQDPGIFSGDVGQKQVMFNVSVTQVDKLLACPMKFYFETMMKCFPLDQEEALYWGSKKGNVVHKAFEYFIENKGYALDIGNALNLMNECLTRALEYENIDTDDLRQMDQFRNYIKYLTEDSDRNCLSVNLSVIKKDFDSYTQIESEKTFENFTWEHPDLTIMLSGRIDKIMINEDEKKLITSDFKTGTLTTSLLSKMMLSQLYLYLKYCITRYPEYELKAMYEKLKDPKDCKMVSYMIEGEEFKQLGKNAKQSFMIEDFEEHLNNLFSQIGAGKYYITNKLYKDACEYCPHAGLCRKDTRLKN
jgi:ATP-dependent exoDNAse (exonuclease V) beta subunit